MVDIHRPGDYPILLGDSLKDEAEDSSSYLGVRYNWTPQNGFTGGTGRLRSSSNDYTLSYERANNTHEYVGWLSDDTDQNTQLALFYNNDKSAFVLERVSAAFNFNVKSSSELSTDQIKRHTQLEKPKDSLEVTTENHNEDGLFDDADDESPDQSNPFDFRHFLTEAKEAVEKVSHIAVGGRTPVGGARTPLNAISSPLPGATSRFLSTTPQFAPTEIRSTKRKTDDQPPQSQSRRKTAATMAKGKSTKKASTNATSRPRAASGPNHIKPLSSEIAVDSSDDDDDSNAAAAPSPPPPRPEPTKSKTKTKAKSPPTKTHNRAASSPKVTDDDDDDEGGLEIVDDSPPVSAKRQPHKINPDSFRRGNTDTSTISHSRNINTDTNTHMHDASDVDEDVEGLLPASDDDVSQNGDVPDLILEESEPEPLPAPRPKRRQSSTANSRRYRDREPPVLPQPVNTRHDHGQDEDEDDDGGLAAALEEALEREAQMQAAGAGGDEGFGNAGGGGDEESEISEED